MVSITTSAARTVTVAANQAPAVSLTAPADGTVFIAPAAVTLAANAADADGTLAKVEFYQGATLLGTVTAPPYSYAWTGVPVGSYQLTAKATDNNAAVTTSAIRTITVLANQAPTVNLTSPTANQGFAAPATIQLAATASDPDNALAKVEFFQGATLIATVLTPPYASTWENVAAGSYQLTAKATDALGAETSTAPITINVTNPQPSLVYLHADHLNTPRLATDETGRVIWRNLPTTEPFGNSPVEEDPDNDGVSFTLNLRFPGQYYDRETNLHYNYFRDYDPATGRYVQPDPLGLAGGINTYAYVNGNPLSLIDPLGLMGRGGGGAGNRTSATRNAQRASACLCKLDSRFCIPKTSITSAPPDILDSLFGILPAGQTNIFGQITVNSGLFSSGEVCSSCGKESGNDRAYDLLQMMAHETQHKWQTPWVRWYTQVIDSATHDVIDKYADDFVRAHKEQLMRCLCGGQ